MNSPVFILNSLTPACRWEHSQSQLSRNKCHDVCRSLSASPTWPPPLSARRMMGRSHDCAAWRAAVYFSTAHAGARSSLSAVVMSIEG